jgi:Protein of unknown function (DUF4238)
MKRRSRHNTLPRASLPRFNHYVPEFILNYFATHGKICVFDKHTLKNFKLPPRRAMGERDYNNVRTTKAILSFENRFTYVENLAAPIIAKIIHRKTLDDLAPMDIATLHMFAVIQFLRSKSRRLDQDAITNEIQRRWPEAEINPRPEAIDDFELAKFSTLEMTFNNLDTLTQALVLKHVFLMVRDCADPIYISDNPLVMHNQRTYGPYGNIGLAVPGIEIYYPLSPDIVLAYLCPSSMKDFEEKQTEAEKQASSFFETRMRSRTGISKADTTVLAQMRAEIQRSKDYYRLIKEHRVVPMDTQGVAYLNSLQLMSSYRFVAASESNFSFARKALSERPHWKEGLRVKVA